MRTHKPEGAPSPIANMMVQSTENILQDINHIKPEVEPFHKISQNQIAASKDIYLKPSKSITDRAKFNETYRQDYENDKQLVCFVAEHREIIGEKIEIWTHDYAGIPAEFWEVPTGKPVWGPRYLAKNIADRSYRRLKAENAIIDNGYGGQIVGGLAVESIISRLEAFPADKGKKNIFMG